MLTTKRSWGMTQQRLSRSGSEPMSQKNPMERRKVGNLTDMPQQVVLGFRNLNCQQKAAAACDNNPTPLLPVNYEPAVQALLWIASRRPSLMPGDRRRQIPKDLTALKHQRLLQGIANYIVRYAQSIMPCSEICLWSLANAKVLDGRQF